MSGIDRFLATELSNEIKNHISEEALLKLERRLFLDEGMSIKLSMEHFNKFHNKLKQVLEENPVCFEKTCLEKICKFKKSKENITIKIINSNLIQKILENFGDKESRKIITQIMAKAHTTPEILDSSKMPKTSAYRKIENLILDGFIIEESKIKSESKKISKYRCIFEQISIRIKDTSVSIEAQLIEKQIEKSSILKKLVI